MNHYFSETVRIIDDALKTLDDKVFDQLVNECYETLKSGHKIIASGLGKNVPICDKFVGTMLSLGFDAGFLHTNSAVHGDMGMVKPGDLVIILTKSGVNGRVSIFGRFAPTKGRSKPLVVVVQERQCFGQKDGQELNN